MSFFVYILQSRTTEQYYIGHTNDVSRRVAEHNDQTRSHWAASRGPWKLKHVEKFHTRAKAMQKEKSLKLVKNRGKLSQYIAGWRSGTSGGS